MQTVSPAFASAATRAVREPASKIEVMWDGASWTDETNNLIRHSGTLRLSAPGEDLIPPGDIGVATVEMHNPGQRYSWFNTAGPLYDHISGPGRLYGKRVRLRIGFAGLNEWVTVFTGVIYDWSDDGKDITLYLRDMGHAYLQRKASSAVLSGLRADEVIATYAELAGISGASRVLDIASERIPYAWMDDESAIEEIWNVAASVGGRSYFDQSGKLRFETASAWAGRSVAIRYDYGDYEQCLARQEVDALATEVVIEWSPRFVAAVDAVYTLNESKLIRPGETLSFEARFTNPLCAYAELTASDYRVISVGGSNLNDYVTVSLPVGQCYAQRCTVQISNSHTTLAALLVYLQIRGSALIGGPTDQVSVRPGASLPFERVRSLRGNTYVQSMTQAKVLAHLLAGRCQRVTTIWNVRQAIGLPHLELGDLIRVAMVQRDAPVDGYVTEIAWTFDPERGYMHDLTLMDAEGLYPYSDYYVIGQTALGAGRAWY